MPKQKTKRAAMKRFRLTGTGKIKRSRANKRHILTKKTTKRKNPARQVRAGQLGRLSAHHQAVAGVRS